MRGNLEVANLSVSYSAGGKRLRALDSVSLSVPAGHRMAIVGESGSGKSTLGLALMGLLPGNSSFRYDSMSIDGAVVDLHDLKRLRSFRGRTVSMVFQDAKASLDPVRTVGSQIAELLKVHHVVPRKEVRSEVERLLADVEIRRPHTTARQYPHELSGGMRQRAMIASALAGRPSLLIADEPTSALDVTTQATVIDLIRRLGDDGTMSTLLITHDLALVAGFADSVTVMYAGQIVETATVDAIYAAPAHPYTAALLGSIPSIWADRQRLLGSIPGTLPDLTEQVIGCPFEPRCPVGHGNEQCRTVAPAMTPRPDGSQFGEVACHFPVEGTTSLVATGPDQPIAVPVVVGRAVRSELPIVEMRSIVKTFRAKAGADGRRTRTVAVGGVDLRIGEGESVGIVGESGSGKTTLARIVVGLETADSGQKLLPSGATMAPVERLPKDFVQFVFQDPGDSLNPMMTINEIISEPLVLRDGGRAKRYQPQVATLLEDVGLHPAMGTRRSVELSGGQRQRIAIARALSTQPKLIIADEAVASLDMSARGQILNLLSRLQSEHGFAYLYISHDLSMVRHVCDRVVVMYSGKVVETASADELFAAPRHPYTQALISAVPIPDPAVERTRARVLIRGEATDAAELRGGCSFRSRCPLAQERCVTEVPVLDPNAEHGVACHFADEAVALFAAGATIAVEATT